MLEKYTCAWTNRQIWTSLVSFGSSYLHSILLDQRFWNSLVIVTSTGWIVSGKEPHFQQDSSINKIKVPQQPIDDILLIDPNNRKYVDLPNDMTNDANEYELYESDDLICLFACSYTNFLIIPY